MQNIEKEERLKKAYLMASEMFNSYEKRDDYWHIDDKYYSYLQQYRGIANTYICEAFKNWKDRTDKLDVIKVLFDDISSSQAVFVLATICECFKENKVEDDTYFKDILSFTVAKKAVELLDAVAVERRLKLVQKNLRGYLDNYQNPCSNNIKMWLLSEINKTNKKINALLYEQEHVCLVGSTKSFVKKILGDLNGNIDGFNKFRLNGEYYHIENKIEMPEITINLDTKYDLKNNIPIIEILQYTNGVLIEFDNSDVKIGFAKPKIDEDELKNTYNYAINYEYLSKQR